MKAAALLLLALACGCGGSSAAGADDPVSDAPVLAASPSPAELDMHARLGCGYLEVALASLDDDKISKEAAAGGFLRDSAKASKQLATSSLPAAREASANLVSDDADVAVSSAREFSAFCKANGFDTTGMK